MRELGFEGVQRCRKVRTAKTAERPISPFRTVRYTLVPAAIVLATLVGGCANSTADDPGDAQSSTATSTASGEDFVAEEADFTNLADMTPVRGFFIDNRIGLLDEAVALADAGGAGTYPVARTSKPPISAPMGG